MGAISQSVGLFGATGELGRAFFDALEEQGAFVGRLRLFASERSSEETRLFRDKPLAVEVADDANFDDLNEAILAVPADIADDLAARLLAAGVRVWDASGHLRAHPQAVKLAGAGPDSALVVLADPLAAILAPVAQALDAVSPLQRLDVTVLAPVSLRGRAGVGELARQTGELLNGRGISTEAWPQQVAFNILSADTALDGNGTGTRERRVRQALAGVLPQARIHIRQLVVPVFYGATMSLHWQHAGGVERAAVAAALAQVPGVRVHEDGDLAELPSPVGLGVDNNDITVSRLGTEAGDGLAVLLADPLRAGLVRPLLAALLNEG